MREIDRLTTERYATPSLLLMEAAAAAAARSIAACFSYSLSRKTAHILCGRGNNGGDGAALARALWLRGAKVDVVLFGHVEDAHGDARTNFEIVRRLASFEAGSSDHPSPLSFIECDEITAWEDVTGKRRSYDIIVDALFGTGLTRPLAGVYRKVIDHLTLIRAARECAAETMEATSPPLLRPLIVSLDLPSGLNADSAEPIGEAVRADVTVTFTAPKPANVLPPAAYFGGSLVVADIGSPPALLGATPSRIFLTEASDARVWLEATRYAPDSYKNTHGHALIIAGSRNLTGAAVLCGEAAMRSGAGLVTVATPASASAAVAARVMPEVITAALPETEHGAISFEAVDEVLKIAERATVIAIGPGLTSEDERTRLFVRAVIERRTTPVIIDADGLNALAPWPEELRGSAELPLILTPHLGEMRRLMGNSDQTEPFDRVEAARAFAVSHQTIVVLKGSRTIIATPDDRIFINPTGNAGLGTAGSGDTLTGLIAGFNAQAFAALRAEADAVFATIAAVFLGGMAGDRAARESGMRTLIASDIGAHLSAAVRALDEKGERP